MSKNTYTLSGSARTYDVIIFDTVDQLKDYAQNIDGQRTGRAFFIPKFGDTLFLGTMGLVKNASIAHTIHEIWHLTNHILRVTKGKARLVDEEGKEAYLELEEDWRDEEAGAFIIESLYKQIIEPTQGEKEQ